MYYNLYYLIIRKIPIFSYRKLSLVNKEIYHVILNRIKEIKYSVKKIDNWWDKNKLPSDVIPYNHMVHCEFLINFRYNQSQYYIPNLLNSSNVWLMLRYYRGNHYIQFNRNEDNVHKHRGFIIGRTDINQRLHKLTQQEFLICLKRYHCCVNPKTNIIWVYKNNKRKPIGILDKCYNIHSFYSST